MADHLSKGLDRIEQILKNHIPDQTKAVSAMIEITPIVYNMLHGEIEDITKKYDEIIHEVLSR